MRRHGMVGRAQGSPGAWSYTWTPGTSLANLFALYDSLGDVTISGATNITTALDGPIQVARYGALTVNAALTASQRCRGLVILCDSLSVGAAGSISMTARGAAGSSKWTNSNILVPASIILNGNAVAHRDFLDWIRSTGYCIFDPNLFHAPVPGQPDVQANYSSWSGTAIVSAAGCGASSFGYSAGGAGTTAPGAGGSALYTNTWNTIKSGPGKVWGGGAGMGGVTGNTAGTGLHQPDQYGGSGGDGTSDAGYSTGGGAGNPGGTGKLTGGTNGADGTGGVLIVICRGNVSLTAGHALTANGSQGGNGWQAGSGSGGGFVGLFRSGSLTGTLNATATGGATGTTTNPSGAGGAGAVVSNTFTTMGW